MTELEQVMKDYRDMWKMAERKRKRIQSKLDKMPFILDHNASKKAQEKHHLKQRHLTRKLFVWSHLSRWLKELLDEGEQYGKSVVFQEVKTKEQQADEPEYFENFVNDEDESVFIPVSTPVHMTDEQKHDALMAMPHESIVAFSKLYDNFICDCEKIGIRVSGVEFYR